MGRDGRTELITMLDMSCCKIISFLDFQKGGEGVDP